MKREGVLLALFIYLCNCGIPFSRFTRISYKSKAVDVTPYQEKWFTQTLDHFDFTNTQTYQMRYLISGISFFWVRKYSYLK